MDSRQLQRQQVVAGINARAAVDDSAQAFFDPDLLETFPQLSRRLEAPVLTPVSRPGCAARAGDVAGFGIYRLLLSPVARAEARIDHRHLPQPNHVLEVENLRRVRWPRCEIARRDARLGLLERTVPGLDASVEHGLIGVTEPAEQKPQPCRHRTTGVVINDDPRTIVDARAPHGGLELRQLREGMAAVSLAGHVIELDEHRSRDVAGRVLVTTLAVRQQVPAEIDHAEIVVAKMFGQPLRADERSEAHGCRTLVSWQKWTACGFMSRTRCS